MYKRQGLHCTRYPQPESAIHISGLRLGIPRWASMLMMTPPWVTQAASSMWAFIMYSSMLMNTPWQRLWKSPALSPPLGV